MRHLADTIDKKIGHLADYLIRNVTYNYTSIELSRNSSDCHERNDRKLKEHFYVRATHSFAS